MSDKVSVDQRNKIKRGEEADSSSEVVLVEGQKNLHRGPEDIYRRDREERK